MVTGIRQRLTGVLVPLLATLALLGPTRCVGRRHPKRSEGGMPQRMPPSLRSG
jgi:hypothetical protein